jgi:hypothetical protein
LAQSAELQGRRDQPRLQARAVARKHGDEVAGGDRAVDALAAEIELSGRREGARDRRPGQREVDVAELFLKAVGGVLVFQHAVLNPDFGKRHLILRAGPHRARDALDERRPVAFAAGFPDHADMRPQHHYVGNFEAAQQQGQQTQICGQHVDLQRGIGGAAALQPDIVERDVAARKHRYVDRARYNEIEPGDGADLRLHGLPERIAVEEPRGSDQGEHGHCEQRRNRHPEALHSLAHRQ